ncbi:MAG TPA: chemotaxis protein CheW [Jatrophihabitantaceae bacterium]|nr:chemotaxis protein CheW [Jatrophihabitantaceae bacterium]
MDEMDEIVQEFLIESSENLDQLDRDLLALEVDPGSREILSSAFRTIHTIKGTSGFLAFNRLEKLTHTGESLLSRLRDGLQTMTTPTADALLLMVDTVRALLASIEANGAEGDVEIEPVMDQLRAQMRDEAAPAEEPVVAQPAVEKPEPVADAPVAEAPAPEPQAVPKPSAPAAKPSAPAAKPSAPAPKAENKRSAAESSLRVDVDVLDALMRLAGELVLTRNQLIRGVGELSDPALTRTAQRLSVITTDLQESIMKTRMQPIDHIWSKLPRVVRDLGAQCGRQVRLAMTGQDTELDRALLEAIKDPLTHLVRNSVDHGIEAPAEREAAGKPAEGVLSLRAYHNSGQVVIEVADDGAGIDPAKISAKAAERGLRSSAELAEMSDAELLQLIFEPGFSTAAAVTNVSGRGVGMDVVKTNIEAIGGAIEIESSPGEGTTCRLRVPLTLAIVPALTVECGSGRYAVPQVSLLELVALESGHSGSPIEEVAGAPVYRLRGVLLPLIDLAEVLGVSREASDEDDGSRRGNQVIAVLQAGNRRFGLLVDRVVNTEEIVVKALSARLKNIGVYSGATILGDGKVALILDVQNLARRALRSDAAERAAEAFANNNAKAVREPERLLIAGVGDDRRVAISMSMVTRLEMISAATIESVGSREVVQYRGRIVPLVRLARLLGTHETERAELPVAVYSREGHSVAIVMDEIIDIVEQDNDVRSDVDDHGFVGSVVVKDHVVGLLDVEQTILAADPDFFNVQQQVDSHGGSPVRSGGSRTNGHRPNHGDLVSAVTA